MRESERESVCVCERERGQFGEDGACWTVWWAGAKRSALRLCVSVHACVWLYGWVVGCVCVSVCVCACACACACVFACVHVCE